MVDAYSVLRVSPAASHLQIRTAYLDLACQHHPCKISDRQTIHHNPSNPSTNHTQFRLAAEAYTLIGNESRRQLYDLIQSSQPLNITGRLHDLIRNPTTHHPPAPPLHPLGRSRARSELTIDLRLGLPPELRALLIDLDPIKTFNRVVSQIDQERRLEIHQARSVDQFLTIPSSSSSPSPSPSPPSPSSSSSSSSSSPSFSPPPSNLKTSNLPHSTYLSPPSGSLVDQIGSGLSRTTIASTHDDPGKLPSTSKTGILLRDDSRIQFRQPPSSLSELLSRDRDESYHRSALRSDLPTTIRSTGAHSPGSSFISNSASVGSSSCQRNPKTRKVSFSSDVIQSDQLKQTREVLKSFKSENPRIGIGSKPISVISSGSSSAHNLPFHLAHNNPTGLGASAATNSRPPSKGIIPSIYQQPKPNDISLDQSLYSHHDDFTHRSRPSNLNSRPTTTQDILTNPIRMAPIDRHHHHRYPISNITETTTAAMAPRVRDGDLNLNNQRSRRESDHLDDLNLLATSAPTGFLARYRPDNYQKKL